MKKYRILLVLRHPVGGIRTFFRYFYRSFTPEKYSFVLIAPDDVETNVLANDLAGIDVTFIRVERRITLGGLTQKVLEVMRSERFDLVHTHGLTSAVASVLGAKLTGTYHLVTLHDVFGAKQFASIKGKLFKQALSVALALVDRIHCVSHDAAENLRQYIPILKYFGRNKVTVVLNGIRTTQFTTAAPRDLRQEFGLPKDSFLIGFLGRFMNQKGFVDLRTAFEELRKLEDLPRKPFVLCFSPEDGFIREERAEVKRRGLSEEILFLPFVADVGPTLQGLDVVAMPSRWEACPLLPMEVLVAGVPLVGSDCIGLREVLRNTPARMFLKRDAHALALALQQEMREPCTLAAKAFVPTAVQRFDVEQRVPQLEALIGECLSAAQRRS